MLELKTKIKNLMKRRVMYHGYLKELNLKIVNLTTRKKHEL